VWKGKSWCPINSWVINKFFSQFLSISWNLILFFLLLGFITIFTSHSTTQELSARNEIERDQGLEGFEKVAWSEVVEWFSDLFWVVTEGYREEQGYWVMNAGGFKGRTTEEMLRWDASLQYQGIVVGTHLFKIWISSARSRYPRFPDSILTICFAFLLTSTSTQCKYIGLFQLYFIVNLILTAL